MHLISITPPLAAAVFFLTENGLVGNTSSSCASEAQCCTDNKMWSYTVRRGTWSNYTGLVTQPVASSPAKSGGDWRVLTLDGTVRQGSRTNRLGWDNVWWERGAITRGPVTGDALGMPASLSQTYIDWALALHRSQPPANTRVTTTPSFLGLDRWLLLAPANLSVNTDTQGGQ